MFIFSLCYILIVWLTTLFLHYRIFKNFNALQDRKQNSRTLNKGLFDSLEQKTFPNGMPTFVKIYGRMLLAFLPIWIVGIIIIYFFF